MTWGSVRTSIDSREAAFLIDWSSKVRTPLRFVELETVNESSSLATSWLTLTPSACKFRNWIPVLSCYFKMLCQGTRSVKLGGLLVTSALEPFKLDRFAVVWNIFLPVRSLRPIAFSLRAVYDTSFSCKISILFSVCIIVDVDNFSSGGLRPEEEVLVCPGHYSSSRRPSILIRSSSFSRWDSGSMDDFAPPWSITCRIDVPRRVMVLAASSWVISRSSKRLK